MKKFALALLAVAFTASAAQAQIVSSKNSRIERVKVESENRGYNRLSFGLATDKLKSDEKVFEDAKGKDSKTLGLKGIDLTYLHGIPVSKKLPMFVEVGGRFTFTTNKDSDKGSYDGYKYEESVRSNLMSLSVPVNFTYKHTFSNGLYLAPYVGIHFRLNLIAQEKWETEYDGESEDGTANYFKADDYDDDAAFGDNEDTWKRFQFGGQVGLNIGYKALNLGIGYYFASPIYKYEDDYSSKYDFKIKTGSLALTLGFNF